MRTYRFSSPAQIWQIRALAALLLPLLLPTYLSAQPTSFRIQHSCSFDDIEPSANAYLYDPSDEADRIVAEIVDALGLTKNFLVRASGVRNAVATEEGGRRYILYSTTFLEKFKADTRTRWAAYAVLAHEIGHHLNNDNFGETDMRRRKVCELEADRFSGSVLRMLGATLDESQGGIESLENETETNTHPAKPARREAVATGWKKRDEFLRSRGDPGLGQAADRDGDRVPDSRDQCPTEYGTHTSGCPDSDEDGIPDKDDDCDYEKGTLANRGCPTPAAPADRDADGVPDAGDQCPDKKGEKRYAGCPDTDGDGVPDHKDKCMNEKGMAGKDGCPDLAAKQLSESLKLSESSDALLPPEPFRNRKSGLEMVAVEGGTFTMGSPKTEKDRGEDECEHSVTVSSFNIGKYEVTQADWMEVMGTNPSKFNKENCQECAVETVSWDDAQEFLKKLNARFPGRNYRLPTEEEWEYAARGGKKGKRSIYSGDNLIGNVAWYGGNSGNKTHPVGERKANDLGLYDMSGNVWEWCDDTYKPYAGCSGEANFLRVFRGGSWGDGPKYCRVAVRGRVNPLGRHDDVGFRVVQGY